MPERTTDELIEAWVSGDREAGDQICRRYFSIAREFARRVAGKKLDLDELAAEAIASGLDGIRAGQDPNRFTRWLYGIVRHLAFREFRARKRRRPLHERFAAREPGPRTQVAAKEIDGILDGEIAGLHASSREVLQLSRKGIPRREIARRLGLNLHAVHARFKRGRAQLRERLARRLTTRVLGSALPPPAWEEIAALRPTLRAAVEARHLEDLSREEAARRLGIPLETLDARLRAAYPILGRGPDADFRPARLEWRRLRTELPPQR